ncbi:MAG: hypothetical protein LBI67_00920 [Treponema sp.]|jgi:hypothetical protein|nr:hypothetical protein [Treponema sp.]
MALIIEDGSGIPGANAYIGTSFVDEYFLGERLTTWRALEQEGQESFIISAAGYVDIAFDWQGIRKTPEQGLSWPRTGILFDGFPVDGVPVQVKKAAAETVWLLIEGEELFSTDSDTEIASEQVDVIKISYREPGENGQKAASRFDVLNKLLRGFYKTDAPARSGGFSSSRVLRV